MKAGEHDWVHINTNMMAVNPKFVTEFNCFEMTGAASQGCFPVGSECAKKMKGFTFKSNLEHSHPKAK
jgi:hypothetical protein